MLCGRTLAVSRFMLERRQVGSRTHVSRVSGWSKTQSAAGGAVPVTSPPPTGEKLLRTREHDVICPFPPTSERPGPLTQTDKISYNGPVIDP